MSGLHHVTAIAGPAARNVGFYTSLLGLRLVKKTVNFDDPGTYHLYYGDEAGSPGTILTFFPWEHAGRGRVGIGETEETALRVPLGSIEYWAHRFVEKSVDHDTITKRFGEPVLAFRDPDGLRLALVGVAGAESEPAWVGTDIPAEHAIRGFHGVTLLLDATEATAAILTDVMGFERVGVEGSRSRFGVPGSGPGALVDLHGVGGFLRGVSGAGTVHHVAFRAADDAEQTEMARRLVDNHGLRPTEQRDRTYFRSIYLREPGGVLFEIATDSPGFTIDEAAGDLGRSLKLPAGLERRRAEIEAVLPDWD